MNALSLRVKCAGDRAFRLDIDTHLEGDCVTAIYGPSGSGKSTLLDCIAGLRAPEPGSEIRFGKTCWHSDAHSLPAWERRIGYVFQDARLFPHMSVADNLRYGLQRAAHGDIAMPDICDWLDLEDLLQQWPSNLSAGQKQRVAIGRALLSQPQLLLLDEPLANLDSAASRQCLDALQNVTANLGIPMLYVSHDIEEVSHIADDIVLLDNGTLADQGPLLEMSCRLDTRLSREEQAAALLDATVVDHDTTFGLTQLHVEGQSMFVNLLAEQAGARYRVRIPARDVSLCRERPGATSILNILEVRIEEIEQSSGPRLLVRLRLGEQFLLARITRKSATDLSLAPGDTVCAQIKSAALLVAAGSGQ
ncbi:MAG: molybdenum ABC transporter ATP-binding protein [Halioglobus sp.]